MFHFIKNKLKVRLDKMNYSKKKSTALNVIKKRKIKILLKEPKNNECFECSNFYPEYISLNNGIFLCQNCVREHFKLPKSISYIIKNNLRSLNLNNIQYLCCGGNQKLSEFINSEYPNLKKFPPNHLYKTYAMDYYRKMLNYLIEGGIKPKKPDINNAYNLIEINDEIMNNNDNIIIDIKYDEKRNINKIKSESYMKLKRNKYPRIKPIVGNKNLFNFNGNLSRFDNNLNLTVGNLNNSLENDLFNTTINNNYNNYKLNSSTDFKQRNFSKFSKLYDNNDVNTTDINDLSEYNNKKEESNNNNENLKYKKKNKKRTKIEINNNISTINNINYNNRNSIYSKPISHNYLNTFQDNSNYYKNIYSKNENNNQIDKKQQLINSIDNFKNLRSYMSNNKNKNKKNIFELKQNHKKNFFVDDYQKNKNININNFNNINNNIIINRNLNIIYNNNNSSNKIFKKKTIGNSFSINDKKHKFNKMNNYFKERRYLGNVTGINNSVFNIKQRYNNDFNNTEILSENNEKEKIKVNKQIKSFNNINSENNYINNITFTNESEHNDNNSQKSKIIQRISRALKTQKEREEKNEKIKKFEKIKVHQKEKERNKNITPKKRKIEENKKEDITPKGDDIKKDFNKTKNSLSIKELIKTPFGKKRNILDIIKSNNLSEKLVSPNSKNIYQISTDPKRINKKEMSNVREKYKRKVENW